MSNINNIQPLALVHNNELIYIEENEKRKFSCFKIFKLKGPIDVNYWLNIIFPPSEKNHYSLEVSEYNGRSAKVKFNFTNRTHTDLIQHLQNSAAKFYDISENGLVDWLASDTITFKTIYQNTDMTAIQQLRDTNASDYNNSTQLYPIVDEEAFERELDELCGRIASQKNPDLERIFHNTFQRRDMTITIKCLTDDFFVQADNVVAFIESVKKDDDSLDMLDMNKLNPENISLMFARNLYKLAERHRYVDKNTLDRFVRDYRYKFGLVTLWNLVNTFYSTQVSYKKLLKTNEKFKQIFQSQKADFMNFLSNMDKTLMDLLIILRDEINREKYEKLQRRLANFIKATENLVDIIMIINNKCNEQLEELEDQKKGLTSNLLIATTTFGVSVLALGGYFGYLYNLYNNNSKRVESEGKSECDEDTASQTKSQSDNSTSTEGKQSNEGKPTEGKQSTERKSTEVKRFTGGKSTEGIHEKLIGGALIGVAGAAGMEMINGYSTRKALQNSIEQQLKVLDQLKSFRQKLLAWNNRSEMYIEDDIDGLNDSRMDLHDEFSEIRSQCKCLGEVFDMLEIQELE